MSRRNNSYIDCGDYYTIELYYPLSDEVCDYAYISKQDYLIAKQIFWYKTKFGYARGYDGSIKREVLLHKHITQTTGETIIDHINRNKLDCRRFNMRIANKQINSFNRCVQGNSATGIKGVSYDARRNKYRAYLKLNGIQIWLGYFDELDLAKQARINYENAMINSLYNECEMMID